MFLFSAGSGSLAACQSPPSRSPRRPIRCSPTPSCRASRISARNTLNRRSANCSTKAVSAWRPSPRCARRALPRVVVPLEELRHRLARIWSPVGHLNAVMNSEALRAAYTACLPLLSEYYTDLAQSEPLYRAYQYIREHEAGEPRCRAAGRARARAARFPPCRRGAGARAQVALQGGHERTVAAAVQIRGTGARCHQRLVASPDRRGAAQGHQPGHRARRRRGAPKRRACAGWIFGLDQPTYVAVVTDAESAPLCGACSTKPGARAPPIAGPSAGRFDNTPVMEDILRLRHEAARLLDFKSFAEYALADRMAHTVPEVRRVPASAGRGRARQRHGRARRARGLRRARARGLGHHLLLRAPAAEPL